VTLTTSCCVHVDNQSDVDVVGQMLQEARSDVQAADQKASILLAAAGIGIGALLGGLLSGEWNPALLGCAASVLWWYGATSLAIAVVSAGAAVWPRIGRGRLEDPVYYWGQVATYPNLEILNAALDVFPPDPVSRTRHQLFNLSKIVSRKYRLIQYCIGFGVVSVFLFTLAVLL